MGLIPITRGQTGQLVDICAGLVKALNARYGPAERRACQPFYLFHRHRILQPSEGRWMGWERKRGKLLDLNQLHARWLRQLPGQNRRALGVLPHITYVITLDSDTQLPRDSAHRLVGAMAPSAAPGRVGSYNENGCRRLWHPAAPHRHQH